MESSASSILLLESYFRPIYSYGVVRVHVIVIDPELGLVRSALYTIAQLMRVPAKSLLNQILLFNLFIHIRN